MTKRIWKDIKNYEGEYQVSNDGLVKSLPRYITYQRKGKGLSAYCPGKILRPRYTKDRYLGLVISHNGSNETIRIHRAVAQAFIPNSLNLPIINHKDGNKSNNVIANLEWTTYKENTAHAYRNGLATNYGSNHYLSKLRESDVLQIREIYLSKKLYQKEIARMFNVCPSLISYIISNKRWKHI